MKGKVLLFLLSLFVFSFAHTQTIYRLKFRSPLAGDATLYDTYFSVSSNGTGFIRVNDGKTIAEMKITEEYALGNTGIDTNFLYYQPSDPVIVKGNKKAVFPSFVFWFKVNDKNTSDPWAVMPGTNDPVPATSNFLSVEFIRSQDIVKNKNTVLNFFADTSTYFKNLFGPKSKGGTLTAAERMNTRMFLVVLASTKDSTLIPYTTNDARKVIDMFSDIAKNVLGIRFFADSIYGDRYNKTTVENAIKKLNPGKNDIVIFYYSGHGFTDRNYEKKDYPFMDLRDPNKRPRPDARTQTLNIQDIYDSIVKKGARLNLVLSDCCNDTIEAKKTKGVKLPGQKGFTKSSFENVRTLFMNKIPMNFLMTAASKDERAIITPEYSSYFTNFFLESLRTYLSPEKPSPSWFQVLGETQKQTRLYADKVEKRQTPKLFLGR